MALQTRTSQENTIVQFNSQPTQTVELTDDWAHVAAQDDVLGEHWVGETHFYYLPDSVSVHRHNVTTDGTDAKQDIGPPPGLELPSDAQSNLDHWSKEGTMWTRHHTTPRTTLFDPKSTPDGPDYRKLEKQRVTTLNYETGITDQIEDD